MGGQVPALAKTVRSGRPITVIDGCPFHCTHACLEKIGVNPERHIRLYDCGFGKHYGESYDDEAVEEVCRVIVSNNNCV